MQTAQDAATPSVENGAVAQAMTGSRFFAETLKGYGTTHVFIVPTVLLRSLAEMETLGIKPVSAHGEKAAAYMADGYARASGKPGLCMAQTVGAANLSAGLKDAYMAGSPVIAITGGPTPKTRYRHVYQEIRDAAMFEPVTKWTATIDDISRLPELVRQAFRAATAGAPGPVYLQARGPWGQVFDDQGELEPLVETRFAQTPAFRPEPDMESVERAVEVLSAAARPVIVAGGGVVRSGAEQALVALAERLSIPVATSLNAKAAIPEDHLLSLGVVGTYARRSANDTLSRADVVFYVGSHTGSMVTNNWRTPAPGTTIVHLDIDPLELGRVYVTKAPMMGDARAGLERLAAACEPRSNDAWVQEAAERTTAWRAKAGPLLGQTPIRPERICAELTDALPADATLVADTLQAGLWAGAFIGLRRTGQRFIRCAGSLGWGLPAALGAKCARGDAPVVCITGDGGLYYHLAELETARRHNINVVVVVNNNGAYGGERGYWRDAYEGTGRGDAEDLWVFGDRDFARISEELGCLGIRVQRPEDVGPAIARGLKSDRPTVVDVVSDPEAVADRGWDEPQAVNSRAGHGRG